MKTFIRLFALFFALIIVFCAVASCADSSDEEFDESTRVKRTKSTATTVTTVNTVTTVSTFTTAPPSVTSDPTIVVTPGDILLPDIDWGEDTFYILGTDGQDNSYLSNFEISRDKKPNDVVGEAVFVRNERIKNKYNFYIEQELVTNVPKEIQTIYNAQDDIYDLIIYRPDKAISHATMGYLLNLYDVTYLNSSHPTWNSSVNDDFTINERLYFSTNKFLLQDKAMTTALAYNEELAKELLKKSDGTVVNIPELAQSGNWTLSAFTEYAKTASTANSKEKNTVIACDSKEFFASFFYGSGASLSHSVDGTIELTSPSIDIKNKIDIIGTTLFDDAIVLYPQTQSTTLSDSFGDNNTLFCATYVHRMSSEDFELAYILPFPKYDESQTSYYSFVSPKQSSVFAIPYTVADPEQVGFYLEAISEESVDTTYPAFIKSIKWHNHGTEEKLLDLVLSSQKFDVAATMNFSNLYDIISDQLPEFRINVYQRLYNAKGDNPQTKLEEFLNSFPD